jgi:hypothetical protein
MKLKNLLLTASLISFAIGFSDLQESMLFWLGRPFGAILFGLYLIALVLEEPSALFDKQEQEKANKLNQARNPAAKRDQERGAQSFIPALTR